MQSDTRERRDLGTARNDEMDVGRLLGEADEASLPKAVWLPKLTRLSASRTATQINCSRVGGEFCSRTTFCPIAVQRRAAICAAAKPDLTPSSDS